MKIGATAMDPHAAEPSLHPDAIGEAAPVLEDETFARPQGSESEPFTGTPRPPGTPCPPPPPDSPQPPDALRPPHPVAEACRIAADKLVGFAPKRVVGEPDMADADGLVDDLMALAAIMDPVIEAAGAYAYGAIGFAARDLGLFRNQLRDALEGNATFVIIEAMIERTETAAEQDRADRVAFRRA
jgi:hypothetical protein